MTGFRIATVAAIVMGGIALIARQVWLRSNETSTPETVKLSVPAECLDCGAVWETDQFRVALPISNHESHPVEIEAFARSCHCATVEPDAMRLQPGECKTLTAIIDLDARPDKGDSFKVRVVPRIKNDSMTGQKRGPEWTIVGTVKPVFQLSVRNWFLGRHGQFEQPIPPWTLPISVVPPIESLTARSNNPGFGARIKPPVEPGTSHTLELAPVGNLPIGPVTGVVTLAATQSGNKSMPERRLTFFGHILSDLQATPPEVIVGGRRLGEEFEQQIALHSLSGRRLERARLETVGDGLVATISKENDRLTIRQLCGQIGPQRTCVRLAVLASGQWLSLEVPVMYTGIDSK